jgi:putative flippase GtrA
VTVGERMTSWIARMVRHLWRELIGFGVVGLIGVTCDITTFNIVIGVFHAPKVWGSLSGTAIGTIVGYIGNRFWVFRDRELRRSYTEILLYLLVSGVAMGIIAICVAVNEYVLGFKSLIAANLAQFIFGQGLGSIFRFWAMHVWVFPEAHKPDGVMSAQPAAADHDPAGTGMDSDVGAAVEAAKTPI